MRKRAEKNGNGQKKMRKLTESIWKWAEIMRKRVENICNREK